MNRRILFSPIGGTDPIKYLRDGSMLHICRHYQPDIVYLYLSHEMMEYHRKDNRYVDAIERLGEHQGHKYEIRIIERNDLIDVQQYDIFYQDFSEEIKKIESVMEPGDELLINMASGTPAMKSALLVMATLAEYRFKPIQVSTPKKRMNGEYDDREEYDTELNWELNEDNAQDAENRCEEIQCLNLMRILKIETIKKHLLAYDYAAALRVASEIREDLTEDAYRMLQIADARSRLDLREVSRLMREKEYDIYPMKEGDKKETFEYALVLQMKVQKEEYADFIRGITPLAVDLLEKILKRECGIKLKDCCIKKRGVQTWDRAKLRQAGLWDILDQAYRGGFREGPVYSNHIAKLIEEKCSDQVLTKKVNAIVEVESIVRNPAAHDIISVTDEWVTRETKRSIREIFGLIRYLTVRAGIRVGENDWNSYDTMNERIISHLS